MIYVSKKDMINELEQKIKNWDEYSEEMYGYTIEDANDFLKRFRIGIYDCGLNGVLWFGPKVNVDLLVSWDADRRKNKRTFSNISEENLIVYSVTYEIKSHLARLELHPKAYGDNYVTPINHNIQSPVTQEELSKYQELFKKVLITNYNWREAREIRKSFKIYNIYENKNFPHDIDSIIKVFNPEIKKHFPDFFPGKCLFETIEVEKLAIKLLNNEYNKENISKFLAKANGNNIEEYVRRQILSIIDFKRIFSTQKKNYNILKEEFKTTTTLSPTSSNIIFSNETEKEILDLIRGLLTSLSVPKEIVNIVGKCEEFEKKLNCNKTHELIMQDGTIIEQLRPEKHEKKFIRFQKKYEFLFKNATDLEYVEGCLELLGDFLTTQMFDKGNKEIAICLFNTLLISRGILPPVVDLNEDSYALLNKFIETHNMRYTTAIPVILQDTVTQTNQFQNKAYYKTITLN